MFAEKPPVCLDLGASGSLPEQWQAIAPYSTCVAFDADDRDFAEARDANGPWKRLISINRLVVADDSTSAMFYLTKSPHCSSSLQPDIAALEPWRFAELFVIERHEVLPSIPMANVLSQHQIKYIDWMKSDTQGTDLRLYLAIPKDIRRAMTAVEFEPGIIDAYKGEDKLHQVMKEMAGSHFFMSDLIVKGSQRIGKNTRQVLSERDISDVRGLTSSPGWAEVTYLNDLSWETPSLREFLFGWVVSTIKGQFGHALSIAIDGKNRFEDPIWRECYDATLRTLQIEHERVLKRSRPTITEMIRWRIKWLRGKLGDFA